MNTCCNRLPLVRDIDYTTASIVEVMHHVSRNVHWVQITGFTVHHITGLPSIECIDVDTYNSYLAVQNLAFYEGDITRVIAFKHEFPVQKAYPNRI